LYASLSSHGQFRSRHVESNACRRILVSRNSALLGVWRFKSCNWFRSLPRIGLDSRYICRRLCIHTGRVEAEVRARGRFSSGSMSFYCHDGNGWAGTGGRLTTMSLHKAWGSSVNSSPASFLTRCLPNLLTRATGLLGHLSPLRDILQSGRSGRLVVRFRDAWKPSRQRVEKHLPLGGRASLGMFLPARAPVLAATSAPSIGLELWPRLNGLHAHSATPSFTFGPSLSFEVATITAGEACRSS